MTNKTIMLLILLLVTISETSRADGLQSHVTQWQIENAVQGVAVALYRNGQIQEAISGHRTQAGELLEAGDTFSAASISKSFIAGAIMKLVDQKKLDLADSASQLGGLDIPADISIEQLLRHESGLPEYMGGALDFGYFLSQHAEGREAWSAEEIRSYAIAGDVESVPGFSYSNANYVVLGAVIETISGQRLDSALKTLIFDPLELASVSLTNSSSDNPDAMGHSATLVDITGSAQLDARLTRELATAGNAAGGIVANAPDLARWGHQWFSGDFSPESAWGPPLGGQAFGLGAERISVGPGGFEVSYGRRSLRVHGGDGLGVSALLAHDPATGSTIAILVNDDSIRSLGFGEPGYLDALAIDLLFRKQ
ncbi:MAG: serine hydrolase domain-containing protein [Woeseiaceae bacterium]